MNVIDVLITALEVFTRTSRRSGRTTRMLEAYREGDLLVFTSMRDAERACRKGQKYAVAQNTDQLYRALQARRFNNIFLDHTVEEMIAADCLTSTKNFVNELIAAHTEKHPEEEVPYVRLNFMR